MRTVHLLIRGKVQGVFYRATAKERADGLELKGWIKNTKTGDVEAVVSGTDDAVNAFIDWCHKGPDKANVTEVIVTEREKEQFENFRIQR